MLEGRRIVLVEDDEIMGASLLQRLTLEGAEVQWHRQIARALPAIRTPRKSLDAVICDIRLPDGTGEELYDTLTRTSHPPPFLFITGQGGIDQAVRLIRSGAADYIAKPFDIAAFLTRLATVMRPRADQEMPPETGITAAARIVDRQVAEAAARDTPVLIRGAQGLGKLRLARRVHDLSERRAAPILVCNALRDRVGAAELEAATDKVGEGTFVVVGIADLDPAAQACLMAALRAPAFRLIATLGPQRDDAAQGLRADLLSLLQSHEIVVPSLADRPDDAVWLAAQLFPGLNARRQVPLIGIAATAEEAIRAYGWPGNGREVRARLMRAVETAEGGMVMTADLFPERAADEAMRPLSEVRDAAEKAQIMAALDRTHGQVGEAARLLRVSRTTLWEKMQKLGL
ncbi:response regulator [Frigidibacter sp. RF13]|uniref:sigma-54-dependent transcriptional regulator n=1 Tax=Frigidibacter sp. RF13 TaxID=2997340 RepID=UPI00226EB06B|nr:response regulator [Frigidibacter sp. RF13]MCY1127118.1 response regulator [Frigidibacter sp. RF13]